MLMPMQALGAPDFNWLYIWKKFGDRVDDDCLFAASYNLDLEMACPAIWPAVRWAPHHKDPVLLRRALGEQAFHTKNGARSLQACSGSAASIELQKQAALRRAATAQRLREERGLTGTRMRHRRDLVDVEKLMQVSHDRTSSHDFTPSTPPLRSATGPYFIAQELLRTNIAEDQPGVPIYLDWQFIDVSTCGPADLIVDTWSANSTKIYVK
ncbi:hypothetical protein VC83_07724 [Pseudogymnoascus destructans]|uniref:Uncharacterized protein n=1 Tax=Pseudogymnoascus destructans TaxID=655981 RepID=A0A177A2P6_9PEZI|nr:uncharacterized protein VC83_07724 [Pseudogymnoascus destructans]OAF55541.1 hypothetical protein VC83_07724 [Pseudogymnoascus destructans]